MSGAAPLRFRVVEHELVDSTSERAFAELAAGRARHGDVHLARGQTQGRGRLGRRWESAPGEGLYMSIVLLPAEAMLPAFLTMAATLAVRDALIDAGAGELVVKWPNDLLAGDAKLCGVLIESRGLDPARPHYVIGIGINVGQRSFPPELEAERAVTSLARLGIAIEPRALAELVLERLPARLASDPRALANDFLAATGLAGERVRVETGRGARTGKLLELSTDRGLLLALADGATARVPLEIVSALAREGE